MSSEDRYYLIKQRAVPDVLLKVLEAKRLLETEHGLTIQEATERIGLGRSSFYKYKDDIFPFHENAKGKTITFVLQMNDETGLLSQVLSIIAHYKANILTIHQTIPINGLATLTLSVEISPDGDISGLIDELEQVNGIHYVKVLARE